MTNPRYSDSVLTLPVYDCRLDPESDQRFLMAHPQRPYKLKRPQADNNRIVDLLPLSFSIDDE